jgi:succinate-semialdehyde dehydrogenase/glutarate-semialdehyde dehydrogenase
MLLRSTSPHDGSTLGVVQEWTGRALLGCLEESTHAQRAWGATSVAGRCEQLLHIAELMRADSGELARLITLEMGKLLGEARAEIEGCARLCEYFAEHGPAYVAEERVGGARVRYRPYGGILLIVPRYMPFASVFRGAIPALVAGNSVLVKHASSVTQCARAIESLFAEGLDPPEAFRMLLVGVDKLPEVVASPAVAGVTFTGSQAAGHKVAQLAGRHGKKVTLQLGGSDPFVVLADADLEQAVPAALAARYTNAGQMATAAKRFVVEQAIADEFIERLCTLVESDLIYGDPLNEASQLAPLASHELRDRIHRQVFDSRGQGAKVVTGCMPGEGPGAYYQASILDRVHEGMPAYEQELFGPVAAILRAQDADDALRIANDTRFSLGASVWGADAARATALAERLLCGQVHVNTPVDDDPGLPYGGIGGSGFGRQLGRAGVREFTATQALIAG